MLASELPTTATLVSSGVWTETMSRTRYVLDPADATLLLSRAWTSTELAAYNQVQATQSTNQTTLTAALTASVATLGADIGLAPNDPLLVKDSSTLNGILASTAATINSSLPAYIQSLARYIKHLDKAVLASAKISTGALSDASTGQ